MIQYLLDRLLVVVVFVSVLIVALTAFVVLFFFGYC